MTENKYNTLLVFDSGGGGACPVQYEAIHNGDHYYFRYKHSWLTIDKNDVTIFEIQLAPEKCDDGYWSDQETNVYLHLLSDAIIMDSLENLKLPTIYEATSHRLYVRGEHPKYINYTCGVTHEHIGTCPFEIIEAKGLDEKSKQRIDKYYEEIRDRQKNKNQ